MAAKNNLCLILAIVLELRDLHRTSPKSVVERALRLVLDPRIKLKNDDRWDPEGSTILAVTALVEAAYKLSVGTTEALIALLTRYLPACLQKVSRPAMAGCGFPCFVRIP